MLTLFCILCHWDLIGVVEYVRIKPQFKNVDSKNVVFTLVDLRYLKIIVLSQFYINIWSIWTENFWFVAVMLQFVVHCGMNIARSFYRDTMNYLIRRSWWLWLLKLKPAVGRLLYETCTSLNIIFLLSNIGFHK